MDDRTATSSQANSLYWQTDDSVADISNRLNVSRRALYELIEPTPADAECANCGSAMQFVNRSAKANGMARCMNCGSERQIDDDVATDDVGTIPPYAAGLPDVSPANDEHDLRGRVITLAAFAVAGAVVGALAVTLVRRRR